MTATGEGRATRILTAGRLRLAWAALRGHGIISGADFRYGELDLGRHRVWYITRDVLISHNRIWTPGPVFFGKGVGTADNEGTAVTPRQEQL